MVAMLVPLLLLSGAFVVDYGLQQVAHSQAREILSDALHSGAQALPDEARANDLARRLTEISMLQSRVIENYTLTVSSTPTSISGGLDFISLNVFGRLFGVTDLGGRLELTLTNP